ncbi:hypothetical protein ACH47Z_28860 [Streptomyces sp. NPDC020192]|uniref:hypothetical protein n=1 Tax=Streptomyces sp. NPDC020192 TaxID=3365066 RepID=UPI00379359F5
MTESIISYGGARVRFATGAAHLQAAGAVPEGMLAGRLSVLSPGTERRQMAATVHGLARDAGYMSLGEAPGGWVLAPAPHGAAFAPSTIGALAVPHRTSLPVAAVGRFQLMAAVGLNRLPAPTIVQDAVVVGSGPVALGCVLALRRHGAERIRVLTARRYAPIGRAPGVTCVTEVEPASATLVFDATGQPGRAAGLVAAGGTLGILGTPDENGALPALAAHRGGWTIIGMHELAPAPVGAYQQTYTDAVSWLTEHLDPELIASWCRRVPGHLAPRIFELLDQPGRPAEPVVLFEWAA